MELALLASLLLCQGQASQASPLASVLALQSPLYLIENLDYQYSLTRSEKTILVVPSSNLEPTSANPWFQFRVQEDLEHVEICTPQSHGACLRTTADDQVILDDPERPSLWKKIQVGTQGPHDEVVILEEKRRPGLKRRNILCLDFAYGPEDRELKLNLHMRVFKSGQTIPTFCQFIIRSF